MYFAIIWKNKEISLKELELIKPEIKQINNSIILFDTKSKELISNLWWIIKRWEILSKKDLPKEIEWKKILWTKDKNTAINLKKEFKIKRFKLIELFKTDKEVKNKWIEIVKINNMFWVVRWYQNIRLYEKADFEKPSRSMKMWMMPAKLTHIMINIWLSNYSLNWKLQTEKIKIFDPFAWSWTTWFIANYMWYNFVWSDIDIRYLEKNKERWYQQSEHKEKWFEIFQQDINKEFSKEKINWKILIVSEWWLWPIVKENTNKNDIKIFQEKVKKIYLDFINRIKEIKNNENEIVAIFTIPYYIKQDNFLEEELKVKSKKENLNFESINEIYSREKQKVWRKIIIIK